MKSAVTPWHLVAVTAAFAVVSAADAQDKPWSGTTIRMVGLHNATFENMKPFIARFEEETGMRVILEQLANPDLFQKATVESAAGSGYYDIMRLGPNFFQTFAEPGWIVPLDDYVAESGYDLDDFIPSALDALGRIVGDDRLWALPLVADTGLLAYRTDLFEDPEEQAAFEAEYGYPLRPPATTREWLDAAEFFTRDTDGDGQIDLWGYGFAQQVGGPSFNWTLGPLWTFGGEVLDEETLEVQLHSPASVKALEWMAELQKYQPPGTLAWAMHDTVPPMQDGRLAMSVQFYSFVDALLDPEKSAYADRIGFTTIPVYPDNGRGYTTGRFIFGGGGLAIHAHSRNPDAAWAFLSWFLSPEIAHEFALAGSPTPRHSVLSNPEIMASKPSFQRTLDLYYESIETVSKTRPQLAESQAMLNQLGQAWHEVALGNKTADQALADAHSRIETILREAGYDVPND